MLLGTCMCICFLMINPLILHIYDTEITAAMVINVILFHYSQTAQHINVYSASMAEYCMYLNGETDLKIQISSCLLLIHLDCFVSCQALASSAEISLIFLM